MKILRVDIQDRLGIFRYYCIDKDMADTAMSFEDTSNASVVAVDSDDEFASDRNAALYVVHKLNNSAFGGRNLVHLQAVYDTLSDALDHIEYETRHYSDDDDANQGMCITLAEFGTRFDLRCTLKNIVFYGGDNPTYGVTRLGEYVPYPAASD